MKNILLLLFAFAVLLISCSKTSEESLADGKNAIADGTFVMSKILLTIALCRFMMANPQITASRPIKNAKRKAL